MADRQPTQAEFRAFWEFTENAGLIEEVKAYQQSLAIRGINTGEFDGKVGPVTYPAIQEAHRLAGVEFEDFVINPSAQKLRDAMAKVVYLLPDGYAWGSNLDLVQQANLDIAGYQSEDLATAEEYLQRDKANLAELEIERGAELDRMARDLASIEKSKSPDVAKVQQYQSRQQDLAALEAQGEVARATLAVLQGELGEVTTALRNSRFTNDLTDKLVEGRLLSSRSASPDEKIRAAQSFEKELRAQMDQANTVINGYTDPELGPIAGIDARIASLKAVLDPQRDEMAALSAKVGAETTRISGLIDSAKRVHDSIMERIDSDIARVSSRVSAEEKRVAEIKAGSGYERLAVKYDIPGGGRTSELEGNINGIPVSLGDFPQADGTGFLSIGNLDVFYNGDGVIDIIDIEGEDAILTSSSGGKQMSFAPDQASDALAMARGDLQDARAALEAAGVTPEELTRVFEEMTVLQNVSGADVPSGLTPNIVNFVTGDVPDGYTISK